MPLATSHTATLTPATNTPVTIQGGGYGVTVINLGTDNCWVRFDGTAAAVEADGSFCVPPGARTFPTPAGAVTLQIISASATKFSIDGLINTTVQS